MPFFEIRVKATQLSTFVFLILIWMMLINFIDRRPDRPFFFYMRIAEIKYFNWLIYHYLKDFIKKIYDETEFISVFFLAIYSFEMIEISVITSSYLK